jgi:hypothetical protein
MKKVEAIVGSRFAKADSRRSVWIVEALLHPAGLPDHVCLIEQTTSRRMTIAASVLLDRGHFTALVPP